MIRLEGLTDIAVDFDDICVDTFPQFVVHTNREYEYSYTLDDYAPYGHRFGDLWGTDRAETSRRCHLFHRETDPTTEPIPGSYEVLRRLREQYRLHLLTYRDQELTELTNETIERLFPQVFHQIDVCGWGEGGTIPSINKAKICLERGINLIIEDSLGTTIECAESKISVLLRDTDWNRHHQDFPGQVVRVQSWEEIETILLPA